jgi:hypothetical protein
MHRLLAIGITITLLGCGSTDAPAQSTEPEVPVAEAAEPAAPLDGEEDTIDEEHVDEDTIDDEDIDEGQDDEAAATAPDLGAHEVVIVVVHDDPLLRSEERLLDVIAERMQMRRIDAIRRDATDEEASFARSRFAGEGRESALPSSLTEVGTVLFVRIPPNRELDRGQRATRGFGGVIAFRRGEREPYAELRIDDEAAWRGADEQLWPWLISLVRAARPS